MYFAGCFTNVVVVVDGWRVELVVVEIDGRSVAGAVVEVDGRSVEDAVMEVDVVATKVPRQRLRQLGSRNIAGGSLAQDLASRHITLPPRRLVHGRLVVAPPPRNPTA